MRTVHIIIGSMFINIQHKVPIVAFHKKTTFFVGDFVDKRRPLKLCVQILSLIKNF